MFHRIQDQQQRFLAHVVQQLTGRVLASVEGEAQGIRHRQHQRVGRIDGSEVNECHPVLEGADVLGRRLQREAGLTDPSWANQGQEPALGISQPGGEVAQLLLASDERGRGRRQVTEGCLRMQRRARLNPIV